MASTDSTGRDPVELSLREAALMLGLSEPALRERVSRRSKRGRRRRCVEFDGYRFRTRDGRWRIQVSEPWVDAQGRRRDWRSLEAGAALLHMKPATLRRALQRRATKSSQGLIVAHFRGLLACKFGDTWRVCIEEAVRDE